MRAMRLAPRRCFSPLFGSILMVSFVTVAVCCCCCCCCCCFEDRRHLFLSQLFLYLSFYLCNNCCVYGSCYFAFFYLHVHQVTQGSGKYMRDRSVSIHSVHAIPPAMRAMRLAPRRCFLPIVWIDFDGVICYCCCLLLLLLLLLLPLFWRQTAPISIAVIPLSIDLSIF